MGGDPFPTTDATALKAAECFATVEAHESLGSTNDRAKALLADGAALPALVVTREQTAGRGRGANRWWSSDGALCFSLALGAETPRPATPGAVSLLTALALADSIEHTADVATRVKWPNDLVIGRRKAAGVLLESPRPGQLVVGVGLNLNNSFEAAPPEVRDRSVAIASSAGRPVSPTAVLIAFARGFQSLLREAHAGGAGPIRRATAASALIGAEVTIESPRGETIVGTAKGVEADGALVVETAEGVRRVLSGTVSRWGADPTDQAGRST